MHVCVHSTHIQEGTLYLLRDPLLCTERTALYTFIFEMILHNGINPSTLVWLQIEDILRYPPKGKDICKRCDFCALKNFIKMLRWKCIFNMYFNMQGKVMTWPTQTVFQVCETMKATRCLKTLKISSQVKKGQTEICILGFLRLFTSMRHI